jgi:FHA domain
MATLRLVPVSGSPHSIDKDETVIGREPTVDVVVSDGSVSRQHAKLVRRGLAWAVVDQGSANGTYLDSQRIADAVLRDGQELRVGAITFRIEIDAPAVDDKTLGGPDSPDATVVQLPDPPAAQTLPPPPLPPPTAELPPAAPARATPPPPPPPSPGRGSVSRPAPGARSPLSASPANPRKGKGPLFWGLLGCGGCLTMIVLFVAVIGGGVYFMTKGAVNGVEAQIAALRAGSAEEVYEHFSEQLKAHMSREDFEALLEEHPALKDNAEANFWPPAGSVSVVNDRAQITGTLVSRSGLKERVSFELAKEEGEWKISALSVEGGP